MDDVILENEEEIVDIDRAIENFLWTNDKKYMLKYNYFTKALDYADFETRKEIIRERDSYQERKELLWMK